MSLSKKILTRDERLPADWPVAGTTGYDFLNQANGLFVDAANEQRFTDLYREFTGFSETFEDAARAGKKKVLRSSFLSELDGLTRQLLEMASATRSGRDLTFHALREGLGEIIAAFPVYRTYVTRDSKLLSEVEQLHVKFAIEEARTYASTLSLPAINWIGSQLLLQTPRIRTIDYRPLAVRWSSNFNNSPALSQPRASRIPPSTITTASSRSTKSAAIQADLESVSRRFTHTTR